MRWVSIKFGILLSLLCIFDFPLVYADDKEPGIDIATYINNVRKEFIKLSKSKEKEELPLYIEKIHIEMSVVVKLEAEGGVKFYVIDVGGKYDQSVTQKLSFDVHLGGKNKKGLIVESRDVFAPSVKMAFKNFDDTSDPDVIATNWFNEFINNQNSGRGSGIYYADREKPIGGEILDLWDTVELKNVRVYLYGSIAGIETKPQYNPGGMEGYWVLITSASDYDGLESELGWLNKGSDQKTAWAWVPDPKY